MGILERLAPGAFHYGMTCVVEFEAHSLWHEISLAIAAQALKNGIRTEYHVFQHTPKEIRSALKRVGSDLEAYEQRGLFRVLDSYTPTTPLTGPAEGREEPLLSGKAPDSENWAETIRRKMKSGFEEEEKRWLHIDDNETVMLQFSSEESILNGWRTTFVPMVKERELLILHALVTGTASESFYRKTEAMADAVIDLTTREEGGRVENYIRVRALRGVKFDSRWHRAELMSNGDVIIETAWMEEPRRLAAVMFTDMVGFTAMTQANEARALDLLRRQRELIRPIIVRYGGIEVKTLGDGLLIEFASALAATECAVSIEAALGAYNSGGSEKLQLRIGIHVGDVVHEGGDVYGDAVNIASRMEPLAQGGGVCISQQVYDQIRNKTSFRFTKLEAHELKNVSLPIDIYKLENADDHASEPGQTRTGGLQQPGQLQDSSSETSA